MATAGAFPFVSDELKYHAAVQRFVAAWVASGYADADAPEASKGGASAKGSAEED